MNEEIKITKFHISTYGDISVGNYPEHFELGFNFIFLNQKELDFFMKSLRKTFEETFDEYVHIETEEDVNKREIELNKIAKEAAKADENFKEPPMTDKKLNKEINKDWSDN